MVTGAGLPALGARPQMFRARRLVAAELRHYDIVPLLDRARAVVIVVPWLPGAHGMTMGRFVFLTRSHAHRTTLLAHELVHVRQYRDLGYLRFTYRYLRDYATLLVKHKGRHKAAYRSIPFEEEAYRIAGEWARPPRDPAPG